MSKEDIEKLHLLHWQMICVVDENGVEHRGRYLGDYDGSTFLFYCLGQGRKKVDVCTTRTITVRK